MTRKRNNKCRNSVCACTGACFVDDGTGDFAKPTRPMKASFRQNYRALDNLTDAMVQDILETSDEDIIQEMIDDGIDPEQEAKRIRAIVDKAVIEANRRRESTNDH